MPNDDIIKHVYIQHKKTRIPVEEVWQELYDNLEEQTMRNIKDNDFNSWNNNRNFEFNGKATQVGTVYVFVFFIIWLIFNLLIKNKTDALTYTLITCGFAAIWVTILFINLSGKHERNYFNAYDKLSTAHGQYQNKGFKDLVGKPMYYVTDNK